MTCDKSIDDHDLEFCLSQIPWIVKVIPLVPYVIQKAPQTDTEWTSGNWKPHLDDHELEFFLRGQNVVVLQKNYETLVY